MVRQFGMGLIQMMENAGCLASRTGALQAPTARSSSEDNLRKQSTKHVTITAGWSTFTENGS